MSSRGLPAVRDGLSRAPSHGRSAAPVPDGDLVELQQQAFRQVAGTDPDRVELLDAMQNRQRLVGADLRFGVEAGQDRVEIDAEHAVDVDGVDESQERWTGPGPTWASGSIARADDPANCLLRNFPLRNRRVLRAKTNRPRWRDNGPANSR